MTKDALDKNIEAYEAKQKEMEKHHKGKWVVFHDGVFVDAYDTFHNAADQAVRRFGRGPYLIREAGAPSPRLSTSVLYRPAHAPG